MHINPINNNQNNTNFGALKSIKFSRKLSKDPVAQEKLLDAFQLNTSLKNFCKNFDVDIIFDAFENGCNGGESRMAVIYRDKADQPKSFLKRIIDSFKGYDPIIISGYDYTVEDSVKDLCTRISSQQAGIFDYTRDKIYEAKKAKEKAAATLIAKKEEELAQKAQQQESQEKVNERIKKILNT